MPVAAGIAYSEHRGGASPEDHPPLVLIHGAGGSRLHWPPEVRRLRGERVFALDLPGHGDSPGKGMETIDAYADALAAWMGAVSLAEAVWVGHSMGGAIALTLGLERPDTVAGLVLVGTGGRLRVHPSILERAAPEDFPEVLDLIADWAFAPGASEKLVRLARERMARVGPEVLHRDLAACDRFDVLDRVDAIRSPALVLCGDQDRMTPEKYSRFLAEHIPAARLHILERAGHMVMLERPRAVAEAIKAYLEQAFGGRPAPPREG